MKQNFTPQQLAQLVQIKPISEYYTSELAKDRLIIQNTVTPTIQPIVRSATQLQTVTNSSSIVSKKIQPATPAKAVEKIIIHKISEKVESKELETLKLEIERLKHENELKDLEIKKLIIENKFINNEIKIDTTHSIFSRYEDERTSSRKNSEYLFIPSKDTIITQYYIDHDNKYHSQFPNNLQIIPIKEQWSAEDAITPALPIYSVDPDNSRSYLDDVQSSGEYLDFNS